MIIQLVYPSVDLKENGDASNVINDRVVFFPLLSAGSDYGIASLFRTVFDVVWPDDAGDLFV